MTTRYEVKKAKDAAEAKRLCSYQVGDLVPVVEVEAVANCDGTFSLFPIVEPARKKKE